MDREEAKTELQDLTNAIEELENRFPIKNPANQKTITALKIAIEALEQTRWIPVERELPEEGEDVLVYIERNAWDEDGFQFKKKCIDIGWHIDGRWHCDGCNGVVGIAWMPLPPSYEPQESEDKE